jgi:hypothetical protein
MTFIISWFSSDQVCTLCKFRIPSFLNLASSVNITVVTTAWLLTHCWHSHWQKANSKRVCQMQLFHTIHMVVIQAILMWQSQYKVVVYPHMSKHCLMLITGSRWTASKISSSSNSLNERTQSHVVQWKLPISYSYWSTLKENIYMDDEPG